LLTEERAQRAAARGSRETSGRREVKASMPGKVIDVLVNVGDRVESKQGLLVIEAMKMENEIKSAGAGEVKEIHVARGQAVESGEVLVVLE
jgi:biotin carboxyl carrier protein